jgi:hypothetical protein
MNAGAAFRERVRWMREVLRFLDDSEAEMSGKLGLHRLRSLQLDRLCEVVKQPGAGT